MDPAGAPPQTPVIESRSIKVPSFDKSSIRPWFHWRMHFLLIIPRVKYTKPDKIVFTRLEDTELQMQMITLASFVVNGVRYDSVCRVSHQQMSFGSPLRVHTRLLMVYRHAKLSDKV